MTVWYTPIIAIFRARSQHDIAFGTLSRLSSAYIKSKPYSLISTLLILTFTSLSIHHVFIAIKCFDQR